MASHEFNLRIVQAQVRGICQSVIDDDIWTSSYSIREYGKAIMFLADEMEKIEEEEKDLPES